MLSVPITNLEKVTNYLNIKVRNQNQPKVMQKLQGYICIPSSSGNILVKGISINSEFKTKADEIFLKELSPKF